MWKFASRIATFLIAFLILNAGCFSCFMPVNTVLAAAPHTSEMGMNQDQHGEDAQTSLQDQQMQTSHGAVCEKTTFHANIETKRFEPSNVQPIDSLMSDTLTSSKPFLLDDRLFLDPAASLLQRHHFLTGTTIKKE